MDPLISAEAFLNIRDVIVLAGVCVGVRAKPWIAQIARVLDEALTGHGTEYLHEFMDCVRVISHAPFRDIPMDELWHRIMAHAVMNDAARIADWTMQCAQSLTPIEPVAARARKKTTTGNRKIDFLMQTRADFTSIVNVQEYDVRNMGNVYTRVCKIVATTRANASHFAYIDSLLTGGGSWQSCIGATIIENICRCVSSARSRAHGEWIECLVARDIEHAMQIMSFARTTTEMLCEHIRNMNTITMRDMSFGCYIGPRLAHRLIRDSIIAPVLAQYAAGTAEIDACMQIFSAQCVQIQCYDTEAGLIPRVQLMGSSVANKSALKVKHAKANVARALCGIAKNADDAVFARALDIMRAADCRCGACAITWSYEEGIECFARAVRRLEGAGIRADLSELGRTCAFSATIQKLSTEDAIVYTDTILSRMTERAIIEEFCGQFLAQYVDIIGRLFGEPLRRVMLAHVKAVRN